MIVVYGKPLSFTQVYTNKTMKWAQCVKFCLAEPECGLAYDQGKGGCQWYPHGNISTVQQKKKANKVVVAFKVNATSKTCPTGSNSPTFNSKSVSSSATLYHWNTYKPIRYNYSISYSKGVWTFSYTGKWGVMQASSTKHESTSSQEAPCPEAYYGLYLRPGNKDTCAALMTSQLPYSHTGANDYCKQYGSVLSGVTTPYELATIKVLMGMNRPTMKVQDFALRIGAMRSTTCQKTPTTSACKSSKGFTYLDSTAATIDIFTWATNSGAQAKSTDNCVVLMMKGSSPIVADVQSCNTDATLPALAFMCARPAWVW